MLKPRFFKQNRASKRRAHGPHRWLKALSGFAPLLCACAESSPLPAHTDHPLDNDAGSSSERETGAGGSNNQPSARCQNADCPPPPHFERDAAPAPDGDAGLNDAALTADARHPDEPASLYCPEDMVLVEGATRRFCMDRYEAPNRAGALPLVMLNFNEAEAWCEQREKRLCFDDEWTFACAGEPQLKYPYGNIRQPGLCHDSAPWLAFNQGLLNGWPFHFNAAEFNELSALLDTVATWSEPARRASEHVWSLYQGAPSGAHRGCVSHAGAMDLMGNVEEWTRRRAPGAPHFNGNLKGRYWAEPRTCQDSITSHADTFRFYEIGLRCCRD